MVLKFSFVDSVTPGILPAEGDTHDSAIKGRFLGGTKLESAAITVSRHGNQGLARHFRRLLDRWQPPEAVVLITTALIVGLGGGLGAIVFRWLIDSFTHISFDLARGWLSFMGSAYVIVVPAIGGLFVGPLIYFFAREAKGHGVPEVMEAVALRGGRIRPVVVAVKALASSLCIGSGGSVGREGPIVQIGSALGSTLGQLLKLSDERIRNLVACGAATRGRSTEPEAAGGRHPPP